MSTKSASKLLQYNRDLYKQKGPINAEADKAFGTWSYANMYDALYNKFSQNKNFNLDMWQQAFKLGEQDQYLALLEQNKDTELSAQFYDPQYYDYETMMLELYKPMANAANNEERFHTVYDPVSGEQIEESLGEMSDQAYIQYQLDQMRTSQATEITRALEQERKDELGWWKQFGGDVVATMGEFGEGLLSGLAGMADFFVGIGYATGYSGAALLAGDKENQNWLDAFVDYFGDKGLTAAEKRTVRAALDEYERTHTHFRDIDGNMTNIGKYFAGISNSIGMMVPAIIANVATGGAAFVGTATFYTSIFSSNVYENATSVDRVNSPSGIKILNATLKTGAEALIEYGLGKLLGGTIQNQMIGMRGRNINKSLINGFSKTSGLKYLLKSAGQEGLEEFLQDFGTECIDQFTALRYEGYGNTGVTFQTLLDSFFIGALSSMLMSGGYVARNAIRSAVRNKIVPGSGDILIETAEGPQKVTGLNRLQYSKILSDFQQAVDDLKNDKISSEKNVKLAQEVYGAISAISQFYSSFDQQRIKNCEMLLDRVVKAEKAQVKTEVKSFAETVESTFRSMVDEVGLRHAKKLREAAERAQPILEEGGVTEVREYIDADGNELKDGDLQELAERLGNNATTIIDELRKAYDWIIVTDGYASAETEGHIFVPESWLKNYNISEIYKYLEQTRVLEALTTDKRLQLMVNRLVTFDKDFTGQEKVSKERALMDFLFNKSVYQAFLLSNAGKNAHEYKNFIFQLHETIKSLAESSKHHQQLFRGKQSKIRINLLNKIYEQIKETMREPTIKAIINWGFEPQVIGADSVLTPKDKILLNQYAQYKRTLANTNRDGKNASRYENLAEDIIANADFNDEELALVRKSLDGTATVDEDIEARALLEEANRRMTRYDFEVSPKASLAKSYAQRFADEYAHLLTGGDVDVQLYISLLQDMRDSTSVWYDPRVNYTPGYLQAAQAWENNLDEFADKLITKFGDDWLNNITFEDLRPYLETGVKFYQRAAAELAGKGRSYAHGLGTFTIPYQAAAMAMNDGDIAATQFVSDKLDEFKSIYGISARQMITGDLSGMSMAQRNQLTQDMEVLDVDNYVTFVIKKLEGMLGGKYIVTPTRKQTAPTVAMSEASIPNDTGVYDFVIAKSIPAEHFISQDILNEDIETRNQIFRKIFTSMDVQNRRMVPLSMFIDVSAFPTIDLEKVNVFFADAGPGNAGWAAGNRIIIDPRKSSDYFGTLVHEINHIMQEKYNMPNGFSVDSALAMPDFLAYVVNHYPNFIKYALYRAGYDESLEIPNIGTVTEKDIRRMPSYLKNLVAHCGYLLVQGELWARGYDHNGKMVHGFTEIWQGLGQTYLLAPDGKTRFKVNFDRATSTETSYTSGALAGSALDVAVQKLFLLKWRQEVEGSATTARNTYHSALTKESSVTLLSKILSPSVGVIDRMFIKLTDVIRDPQRYLAPEILAKCNGDFSEGNVFYRLKEYVEKNFNGVSLDINDRQEYIWVDDNAFDDLLRVSMRSKAESDNVSIVKQFKPNEEIPLSAFYSQAELNRLGIDPKAYVLIDPTNGGTETIFDREHRHGAIILDVDENTTDASFINDLNHEFRHLLQYYNGFATGFTADFTVTKEMRDDVKKHLPELFKNQEIVKWAKKVASLRNIKNYEDVIVQRYVYYATSGELAAYAFKASDLYAKPVFVNMEAGKPTIFMSWYDAKTGEGRYKTEFLAMRAEDMSASGKVLKRTGKEGLDLPMVDRAQKKDPRPRHFSKKKAENTNLKYYTIEGIDQLDPRIQDFVVATTGYEDKLPKALWNSIRRGKLTMQNFYVWFQNAKDVDDFTFNLINKYIFKNDYITSMEELDEILSIKPAIYWATAQVLRNRGLPLDWLVKENDIDKLMKFMKSLEGTEWYDEILEVSKKFTMFQTDVDEKGDPIYENIAADDKVFGHMRTLAMHFFNGTLAGAFYVGNTFKQTIYWNEMETRSKIDSADKTLGDGMSDDKDISFIDTVSNEDGALNENSRAVGNDIMALYEIDSNDAYTYIDSLVAAAYSQKVDELIERLDLPEKSKTILRQRLSDPDKLRKNYAALSKKENLTDAEKKQLKNFKFELAKYEEIMASLVEFKEKLETLIPAEIIIRGTALVVAQMNNKTVDKKIFDLDTEYLKSFSETAQREIDVQEINDAIQDELIQKDEKLSTKRNHIQRRIKSAGETLCQYLNTGVIALEELPADVQDLIDVYVTAEKTIKYTLNKDAYKVGRGRNTLRGPTDYGRKHYVHKHDLTQGNEAYRHDVSGILEVDKLLRATNKSIREFRAEKKRVARTADEKIESLERRNATLEQKNRTLKEQVKTLKENSNDARITEIRTTSKKKRRISDTPNVFNIISAVDMPYQLRKIFDISFAEMADTKVQFASRDENGQLYNKEDFNEKEFNSRLKHEVNNWDTFYEANRDTLLSLTRNDVLDILEFLKGGVRTLDGPANKLAAFEIFMLGFIVDGARRNTFDWNFSIKEIEIIEKLYEQRASEHGSGLNAVQQMLKVVDPLKKVRQRMFDDWDTVSDIDEDNFKKAVDDLQKEKDPKKQKDIAQKIIEMLREFEKRQIESDETKYPRWSKAWWARRWSMAKSWRYMAMLSSPTTWVRNIISNVLMGHFNKISDMLGDMVFKTLGKGEYRKEQWDLSKTKISAEAKNFIDVYILNNPIFDPTKEDIKNGAVSLYDLSGKYDPRQNKKIQENRELLVNLIANAYENKYAQDRRFDRKTLNYIAKFVDQRISDKWFVRRVASRYFGKMLTIEAQRGKVDLSQGLSAQALDLFAEAVLMANQEYMHKRSAVADMIDNLRDKHPVLHEVLTFWQPFINSSVNWFAETLKYTPVGLANSIKRMCQLEKQITRLDKRRADGELVLDSRTAEFLARRDIGKGILGMILSGLGVMLACSGRLRIDEDDDKFYAYIDEQIKLDISALFASSSIFVGASIAQKWIEQSDGDVATWEEVFTMLTDTMLDGFFAVDLLERHKWGTTWDSILTETESVMRSFIPQAWQTIIACTNHYNIRYSRGFKGMWERWLNTFVPTQPLGNRKINPYTGELEDKYSLPILGGLLQKGILGPKVYWVEVSETERMCRELGVNKNELTGELTVNEQKYKLDTIALNTKYGELNKESLAKIKSQRHKVEMPNGTYQTLPWDKMSDKQRANVIERTFTHNANITKIYMWTQMGHKYYASGSMWAELRKLGITQNVYTGDKGFVE